MEIKPLAGYNVYKTNARGAGGQENISGKTAPTAGKVDTISISAQGAQLKEAAKLSAAVTKEVAADADGARIAELKAAVQNGTYRVPAEKIADAILNGLFA